MLFCRSRKAASYVFSQEMASLPPRCAARCKTPAENVTGISFSSSWARVAVLMGSTAHEPAFSFTLVGEKSVLFNRSPDIVCISLVVVVHRHKQPLSCSAAPLPPFPVSFPMPAMDPGPWEKEALCSVTAARHHSSVSRSVSILF